ncbi:hypothetical protein K1T71_010467 [Dendrolimus kikuchii]|uniref:Uncharacterized protein n=1 Tax=Dendrolimus kikuchii TaxID=765133 RepID=A0ACC1CS16_9NEOP|nr:hypothetical protein K1T71_010467 [Dendrolimus kikuchii]
MKLIVLSTILAVTSSAQLPSRNYIPQAQGSFGQSQSYQESQSTGHTGGGGGSLDNANRRPQQDADKHAEVLKQEQEISETGNYHFGFETSNGIRAEEAGNSDQGQGGYSYKGDDGHTYTVTYTAGEGGFIPQGEHLPVAPPTPEAILIALQQNERDEAAGIFDDGKYNPEKHGGGQANQGHQSGFNSNSGYQY